MFISQNHMILACQSLSPPLAAFFPEARAAYLEAELTLGPLDKADVKDGDSLHELDTTDLHYGQAFLPVLLLKRKETGIGNESCKSREDRVDTHFKPRVVKSEFRGLSAEFICLKSCSV